MLRSTLLLYNFPKMSGVTFHPDLVDRLIATFPGAIGGIKDSSNDVTLQRELSTRHPELRIFPSTEEMLIDAQRQGLAGCISGSVALWPQSAHRAFANGDAAAAEQVRDARLALSGKPLIPQVRERVAKARNDENWLRAMPPN